MLLIGGRTSPPSDRVSVWAFDAETESWSLMEAKGDIPVIFLSKHSHITSAKRRKCPSHPHEHSRLHEVGTV